MEKNRTKTRMIKDNPTGLSRLEKTGLCILLLIVMLTFTASALHYDKQAVSFSTLDELFSPGKELKVWSDTTVKILGISFVNMNGLYSPRTSISWQYNAGKNIPCTLSVGDTLKLKLYATYIRKAENSQIDSLCLAIGPGQFNYVPLQIASFPHTLITSNSFTVPTADTAGKCLHFSRDSVFCTLRHPVYYCYFWGDRFHTSWTTERNALHSWFLPGQYTIKTLARCSDQLYADTLKSPSLTLSSPAPKNIVTGMYKSGFFIRMVGAGNNNVVDFSQGTNNPALDSDLVFGKTGYNFSVKAGLISPGLYDSLPKLSNLICGGAPSETSTVCKAAKRTMDSLVGALNVLCPSVLPDTTITTMNVGQFCLVKTREGHYAILIKVGEYIGGIDREFYYWGYQSDGSRLLNPGSTVVVNRKILSKVQGGSSSMRIMRQGTSVRLILLDERLVSDISVYGCNGVKIHSGVMVYKNEAVLEFSEMNSGVFIVSVKTDRGVLLEVVRLF
jgi:hypothetical protein